METEDISILVVDDEPANVALLVRILGRKGYNRIAATTDPHEGLAIAETERPDIVLLDLHMPGLGGLQFMRSIAHLDDNAFPYVVMLTGDDTPEAKANALSNGARDFIAKPFDPNEVALRIRNLADLRALHKGLESKVRIRTAELEHARQDILDRLGMAAEFRDDATGRHTRRVGRGSAALARKLGLSMTDVEMIERAAPLHDVGKIAIPDHILLKPGPLTDDEMAIMRTHTTIGARLLSSSTSSVLDCACTIALTHHERWDGAGYPHGLVGDAIPLAGRIVAITDFFDALSHDRPYRPRRERHHVIAAIRQASGGHFDPEIVERFLAVVDEVDWTDSNAPEE